MKDTLKDKINERLRYLQHSDETIAFINEKHNIMLNHLDVNIKHHLKDNKSVDEFKVFISPIINFPDEIIHNLLVDELVTKYEDLLKTKSLETK